MIHMFMYLFIYIYIYLFTHTYRDMYIYIYIRTGQVRLSAEHANRSLTAAYYHDYYYY